MRREELLWRQAAGLALPRTREPRRRRPASARSATDQIRDEFGAIAAVAIEETHNFGIGAHSGDARLDSPAVAALAARQ